ncbi:MAG TPA: class I SAM-dependent methyltransferase [Rubrivivax sp.]|nr:methyltransferase domain-containing protein [Pseudomonadota bacterium]HOL36279.1 class I SAM-dependent methyltransferase [Rubrivivax sp.]HPP83711.1 class I SAM-dependent methyltransferase [Rubrivivax sp.]
MNLRDLPLPLRTPAPDAAWRALVAAAAAPYRRAGRFAWHYARAKLAHDPVFRALVERADVRGELHGGPRADAGADVRGARVVDIGCGQGLVASLLQASDDAARHGRWPAEWPAPPRAASYLGIERMPRDVARAEAALAGLALAPQWRCADMRATTLPPCDLVLILDVLHYVDHAAQAAVLARARDALHRGRDSARERETRPGRAEPPYNALRQAPSGARLLLRIGDAADRARFAASQWVDRVVTRGRGHRVAPTWGRPLADWLALLRALGFAVQALPMSRGTPFANILLVADLGPGTPA